MNDNHKRPPVKHAKNAKNKFSGNHQRSWLWGHHAVIETLSTGRWPVHEIVANGKAIEQFGTLLTSKQSAGIPLQIVDNDRLRQLTGSSEHQGLAVRSGQFPYEALETLEKQLKFPPDDCATVPLVVICDRLQDAFNFGAILRCCDGVSAKAVIVGDYSQAEVTPHVVRSSSGAVNHLPIVKVSDLVETVLLLKQLGMQVVAADANTRKPIYGRQH